MTKLQKWLENAFEAVGVYFFTLLGVAMSQYGPAILKPIDQPVSVQITRIILSVGIAFVVVVMDEGKGDDVGKKANIKRRLAHAFQSGATWNVIMGIGVQAMQAAS